MPSINAFEEVVQEKNIFKDLSKLHSPLPLKYGLYSIRDLIEQI